MASIRDLRQSISQMTMSDAITLIETRRHERGIAKVPKRKNKKMAKQTINPSQMVSCMSDSQKEKLRADLLGE